MVSQHALKQTLPPSTTRISQAHIASLKERFATPLINRPPISARGSSSFGPVGYAFDGGVAATFDLFSEILYMFIQPKVAAAWLGFGSPSWTRRVKSAVLVHQLSKDTKSMLTAALGAVYSNVFFVIDKSYLFVL